jgi:hypothetical protein
MKINDLLTEEELDEVIGTLAAGAAIGTGKLIGAGARALGGLWRGSRTLPANVSRVPIPKIPGQVAAQRQAAQQYAGTWWNKIGFSQNSTVGKWRIDSMKKAIIRQGAKNHQAAIVNNMQAATAAQEKLANLGITIATTASVLYGTYDYLMSRWALDPKDPNYEEQLAKLNGEFIMGLIMPKVVGAIGKIGSKTIAKMIQATGFPIAAEVSRRWLGHVARVGEVAAMAWFRTDAGKKWFAETFPVIMGLFTSAGYALEKVIEFGTEAVQGIATMAKGAVNYFTGKGLPGGGFADPFDKTDRPKTITKSFD